VGTFSYGFRKQDDLIRSSLIHKPVCSFSHAYPISHSPTGCHDNTASDVTTAVVSVSGSDGRFIRE